MSSWTPATGAIVTWVELGATEHSGLLECVVAACLLAAAFTVPAVSSAVSAGVGHRLERALTIGVTTQALSFESPAVDSQRARPGLDERAGHRDDRRRQGCHSRDALRRDLRRERQFRRTSSRVGRNGCTSTARHRRPSTRALRSRTSTVRTRPPSIIVGAGSLWRRDQQGGLEAFYASGKVRFVFQTKRTFNPWSRSGPNDYSDPVFATPAVGDITGTGQPDIVFGFYDHNIYALKARGQPGARLPDPARRHRSGRRRPWSTRATRAATTSSWAGTRAASKIAAGVDRRLPLRQAGPKLMWQRCTGQTIWSSPTVGILNNTRTTRRRRRDQLLLGLQERRHQRDHRRLCRQR